MKSTSRLALSVITLSVLVIFITISACTKESSDPVTPSNLIPVLTTQIVTDISHTTAISGGGIPFDGVRHTVEVLLQRMAENLFP